jgi:hypothetical protein
MGIMQVGAPVSVALFCLLTGTASAATPCAGVDQALTSARKQEYATLVASFLSNKAKPAQIKVMAFMREGAWSVAYVSTPVSDDGYVFFQETQGANHGKDVWGGMAQPSEQPEIAAWAKKLGAPDNLARCFALHATGR